MASELFLRKEISMRVGNFGKRIILMLFGIGFSIMLTEGLLYVLGKPHFYKMHSAPPQFTFGSIDDKDIIYFNLPSQTITFIYDGNPRGYFGKDNEINHLTNSWGFRGREFYIEKPKNTFRIAFLGDSFTFGEGVRFADTYPEQVSLLLGQKYKSSSIHFQSYNFGVGGYNTTGALFVLKNIALKINLDVVVLKYGIDDAEPALFAVDKKTGGIIRQPRWYENSGDIMDTSPPKRLIYKLRLSRLIWQAIKNIKQNKKMIAYYKSLHTPQSNGWIESRRALDEIIQLCREKGIACYVICFPILYQLNDEYPFRQAHALVQKEVESKGAFFIDLFLELKNLDARNLWVHPADHHPNEKVNKIAARALVDAMPPFPL